MIGYAKDDDGSVFIIHVRKTQEELDAEQKEKEHEARIQRRMNSPPTNAVSPKGSIFPFHWLFRCFAKRTLLNDNRYYDVFCNNFTYTTDGRMFVGHYIPGEDVYEDLDPFMMMPAEYIFCCGYCCPVRFFAWFEKQLDAWTIRGDDL